MGRLQSITKGKLVPLCAVHSVGARPDRDLHLPLPGVSREHTQLRWLDDHWNVQAGGKNGTFLNGRLLETASARLAVGDVVAFAEPSVAFRVVDTGPPVPFGTGPDGAVAEGETDLLVLGSERAAFVSVTRTSPQAWVLRAADEEDRQVTDGETIVVAGEPWVLRLPVYETVDFGRGPPPLLLTGGRLRLRLDGDHFHAVVESDRATVTLGAYASNELLAELAGFRLRDRRSGQPEAECGWVTARELADRLNIRKENIYLWSFQSRRRARDAGFADFDEIIDARRRGTEIRLGFADFVFDD